MKIAISEKLKPYSHLPGTSCLIPGTTLRAQVYPALIRIDNQEIPLPIEGPVKDFTVQLDLEKGCINVWGHTAKGYMRYAIWPGPDSFAIVADKFPSDFKIQRGQITKLPFSKERLSLGCHKAQDWCLTNRRLAMEEIFPFWLRLGQMTPEVQNGPHEGVAALLDLPPCISSLSQLYLAGFKGILDPRLHDDDYQGFNLPDLTTNNPLSPLVLLTEGARLIRSLFIRQEGPTIKILPSLPTEFHCGRFINIQYPKFGTIDLEWSKKTIRKMIFRSEVDGEFTPEFYHVKSYRLRTSLQDKGKRLTVGASLSIKSGNHYLLDNFMR